MQYGAPQAMGILTAMQHFPAQVTFFFPRTFDGSLYIITERAW